GSVAIKDAVEFDETKPGAFETAAITFEKIDVVSDDPEALVFTIGGAKLTVVARDADGAPLKLRYETQIVGEKDDSVPSKPTRLAFVVEGDVVKATITQTFTAN
ncbi:MAG: hypothetical protein HUK22_03285, partial [Thermoguttaceae bacterium]|nr:hypothetical protein [Thermoguttaceae bacterium]